MNKNTSKTNSKSNLNRNKSSVSKGIPSSTNKNSPPKKLTENEKKVIAKFGSLKTNDELESILNDINNKIEECQQNYNSYLQKDEQLQKELNQLDGEINKNNQKMVELLKIKEKHILEDEVLKEKEKKLQIEINLLNDIISLKIKSILHYKSTEKNFNKKAIAIREELNNCPENLTERLNQQLMDLKQEYILLQKEKSVLNALKQKHFYCNTYNEKLFNELTLTKQKFERERKLKVSQSSKNLSYKTEHQLESKFVMQTPLKKITSNENSKNNYDSSNVKEFLEESLDEEGGGKSKLSLKEEMISPIKNQNDNETELLYSNNNNSKSKYMKPLILGKSFSIYKPPLSTKELQKNLSPIWEKMKNLNKSRNLLKTKSCDYLFRENEKKYLNILVPKENLEFYEEKYQSLMKEKKSMESKIKLFLKNKKEVMSNILSKNLNNYDKLKLQNHTFNKLKRISLLNNTNINKLKTSIKETKKLLQDEEKKLEIESQRNEKYTKMLNDLLKDKKTNNNKENNNTPK